MTRTIVTAKARAFSCERSPAKHRFSVDSDGTVRVYDSVAEHYTVCHALTPRAIKRIRKLAVVVS